MLFSKQNVRRFVYFNPPNLYINLACLSVCLFVCLFVSNKRQNGWTDWAQIFCGTSRDHREGLWMIKISNICLLQNSIFIKFLKILKIHEIFCENPRIIFVLFHDVHKENMFTTNLEEARKKGAKRLEFLVFYIFLKPSMLIVESRFFSFCSFQVLKYKILDKGFCKFFYL